MSDPGGPFCRGRYDRDTLRPPPRLWAIRMARRWRETLMARIEVGYKIVLTRPGFCVQCTKNDHRDGGPREHDHWVPTLIELHLTPHEYDEGLDRLDCRCQRCGAAWHLCVLYDLCDEVLQPFSFDPETGDSRCAPLARDLPVSQDGAGPGS